MAIPFSADEIVRTLGRELSEVVNEIGIAFGTDVVPRTPVDTGHARRNWQANWAAPSGQELPGVDKSGSDTVGNIVSKVKSRADRNPFLKLYIENNVPYITRLNDGSSKQAPPMFVELSINKATTAVRNARKEI